MDKETLRSKALNLRESLPAEVRQTKSEKIMERFEGLDEFQNARHVLAYHSFDSEVDTTTHLGKWSKEKDLYLPKLEEAIGTFIAAAYGELEMNRYGIPEPVSEEHPDQLDLIIVPGVAFDREGHRLGMGKGYYDRFLADQKGILRIGLCFSEQILAAIPKEPYDENVDLIITDEEVLRPK